MAGESSKYNGNVLYVLNDPNDVNINTNIVNGIPQYQDMYIFAELRAERRGRSVLVTTEGTNNYTVENTGLENTVNVNFLGINQNENESTNPNFLKFTTNYYDGSNGDKIQYEGFGITNIKVTINSSFIPQVNIQFVDIRGLAFFNQAKSPYRILFDFPPPTFILTIKGYYGKSLQYKLHLVKYTSEFRAENGNFVIDAQFVALTYAPLTDVLFRYIVNFGIMEGDTANPDAIIGPKNTNDLITKLRSLYTNIENKLQNSPETQNFDTIKKNQGFNNQAIEVLTFYKNNVTSENSEPFLALKRAVTEEAVNTEEINSLNQLTEYNQTINTDSTKSDRLYVVFVIGDNDEITSTEGRSYYVGTNKVDKVTADLKTFKNNLISTAKQDVLSNISPNDITDPASFINGFNIVTNTTSTSGSTYVGIDVTEYYTKLYKRNADLKKELTDSTAAVNLKINTMVESELEIKPTIYNIFKILLDDVDTFFRIMKKTSEEAETSHNDPTYKNLIIGNPNEFQDATDKLYAFPLIVYKYSEGCGGGKEKRIAPIELRKQQIPFPELDLVYDFINTFLTQKENERLADMKNTQTDQGTNIWIPISPLDSSHWGGSSSSPYAGIDPANGGSANNPINISSDRRIPQILNILLNRFYILTQNSIPDTFYHANANGAPSNKDKAYIELYAQGEAANLAVSISNPTFRKLIKEFADTYKNNYTAFTDYLSKNVRDLYDFPSNSKAFMPIVGVGGVTDAYVNKNDPNFTGINISNEVIVSQDATGDANNPVVQFKKDVQKKQWSIITSEILPEKSFEFTTENVLRIKDGGDNTERYESNNIDTRFLAKTNSIRDSWKNTTMINKALTNGNKFLEGTFQWSNPGKLNLYSNVIDVWVDQLAGHDDTVNSLINGSDVELSTVMLLSNFGFTLSPFNIYPHYLNTYLFSTPAVIETPEYLPAYVGSLVDADTGLTSMLKDFFTGSSGSSFESAGLLIFADIHDVNTYLSDYDKAKFRTEYTNFLNTYKSIITPLNDLYLKVSGDSEIIRLKAKMAGESDKQKFIRKIRNRKEELYNNYLKNGSDDFKSIILPFTNVTNVINFSQLTFRRDSGSPFYTSISTTDDDPTSGFRKKSRNEAYFNRFFNVLSDKIKTSDKTSEEEVDMNRKMTQDDDIVTQTYYSFKNINDKWLANPNKDAQGYPYNEKGKSLIDLFAFVDRGMNPVGNTIINPEILLQMFDDTNISVFSVLSQLLSLNGFEFFPLQNFMTHDQDSWEKSFKIDVSNTVDSSPAFVCMYIGGTSSYPTGIGDNREFKDDGINDITSTTASDFFVPDDCDPVPTDDAQIERNPTSFPWRQVRAFRVLFGTQNQSMFTNIKIDSKEYPETNESIQILARIAGDNKLNAPIPKGQNLYNLYENRAYKATVTSLGNAMIQPTQYFQLENVPLFNGAYLILSVEHSIEPNKMFTSFSGTKILRYPVPRVLNVATAFGFDGDNSISGLSPGEISMGVGNAANVGDQAKYNSMYDFKIQ